MQEALIDFFAIAPGQTDPLARQPVSPPITIDAIFRALDLVPTPILLGMDPASTIIRSNAAGRTLFGDENHNLSQSAAVADRPNFQVFSDGRLVSPNELPMQRASLTGRPTEAPECEPRFDDGTVKYIRGRAVPVFGYHGDVRGSIGVFLDVTQQREADKRHALMTEEVKHRAKNTLALVSAVAKFTIKPKLAETDFKDFEERLQAIARSVDVFTTGLEPSQSIAQLISATIAPQVGSQVSRVRLNGPTITLPYSSLAPLGMAIHELATNACKYGALSVQTGTVSVNWSRLVDMDVVVIEWVERGGPAVVQPSRQGFGSRLLRQILGSPGGKKTSLTFSDAGLECRLFVGLT